MMGEAVMASDRRIYDKANMEKWLSENETSPVTGKPLRHTNLMPFSELTDEISRWKMKHHRTGKRKRKRRKSGKGKDKGKVKQMSHVKLHTTSPSVSSSSLSSLPQHEHEEQTNEANKG